MVEIIHPSRRSSATNWLVWPAAIAVGGVMGVGAFYGAQQYRQDPISTPDHIAQQTLPTSSGQSQANASDYTILPGSTGTSSINADIPSDMATPDVIVTPRATPVSVPKKVSQPVVPPPTPTQMPLVAASASPTPVPTHTPTPSPSPTPEVTPHAVISPSPTTESVK